MHFKQTNGEKSRKYSPHHNRKCKASALRTLRRKEDKNRFPADDVQ